LTRVIGCGTVITPHGVRDPCGFLRERPDWPVLTTNEVQEVALCEDTTAHGVLALLSERARTGRKVALITPAQMAVVLGTTSDAVRSALYDLYDDGDVERLAEGEYAVLTKHTCVSTDLSHSPRRSSAARSRKQTAERRRSITASGSTISPCTDVQDKLESSSLTRGSSVMGPGWENVPETRLSRPVGEWNAHDFATHFKDEMYCAAGMQGVSLGPNPVNFKAMVGNFAAWRKDDIPNSVIKTMIDLFVADLPRRVMKGTPVWKIFLSYRTALFRQVEQMAHDARLEATDVEEWMTPADDDDIDIDTWMMGAR
jgi:hypothetical protein